LFMKRAYARTGKRVKVSGSADQIAAPNGTRKFATNAAENRSRRTKLFERFLVARRIALDQPARGAVEAHDLAQQAEERRAGQVPALCEQRVQVRGPVFEAGGRAHSETHVAGLRRDAELVEK